jgi:hypothetical protein
MICGRSPSIVGKVPLCESAHLVPRTNAVLALFLAILNCFAVQPLSVQRSRHGTQRRCAPQGPTPARSRRVLCNLALPMTVKRLAPRWRAIAHQWLPIVCMIPPVVLLVALLIGKMSGGCQLDASSAHLTNPSFSWIGTALFGFATVLGGAGVVMGIVANRFWLTVTALVEFIAFGLVLAVTVLFPPCSLGA